MKTNKIIKVLILILAIFYAFKCAKNGHDFEVFVDAGSKIIHGQNIYAPPFAQGLQYYYSPLFALLLAPLSALPIMVSQLIWIFLSYFFLYRIWILSTSYFDVSKLTKKQQLIWLVIAAFLAIRFILIDIGFVQMTSFLLWATLQSMQLIKRGYYVWGASLLALAINIKLLPLAFLFYLVYRKETKAAFFTAVFYVIYLFLPALYLGWDKNISFIHNWFSVINPTNKEWTIEAEDGPSSLVALIPVYITKTTGVLTFKRNFLNLQFNQVLIVLNCIRAAFVALTLVFLNTRPFKEIKSSIRSYWEMCYLFIVIPLIYPHQQQYAFLYIAPAFIYLSWYFVMNWEIIKAKMSVLHWVILAVILFNFSPLIGRDVITSHFFEVLLYLRILPMAVILLIPVLWICRPRKEFEMD
jgi:hypothetical protein